MLTEQFVSYALMSQLIAYIIITLLFINSSFRKLCLIIRDQK